ncbi:MAG: DnaJ C-terminal domain-containing protein [Phycisphaeraceae bacterium]
MAVKFEDYYEILGAKRDASQDDIRRAYRKLARQQHPDVNKAADAAERFAKLNEAYEVLGDPAKRKKYDELGQNWKNGQDFRPPPGFENMEFQFRGAGGPGGGGAGGFRPGGFSDFFEMFFGRGGAGGASGFEEAFAGGGRAGPFNAEEFTAGRRPRGRHAHQPQEAEITITLDEAYHGGRRQIELQSPTGRKNVDVKIPGGTVDGSRIRLRGENLILRIKVAPHSRFQLRGHDLTTDLHVAPHEAALGAKVEVKTLDGPVTVTVPPGSQSGQKLRLRGRGLPKGRARPGEQGDLYVRLLIRVPHTLSDAERDLYEKLKEVSKFNPRT